MVWHSDCLVESDGWTNDLSQYRQWLDGVQLTGGGRFESAMAEGLQEAMFLYQRPSQLGDASTFQNHLLLLMAAEPHRLLVPWPFPEDCSEVCLQLRSNISPLCLHTCPMLAQLGHAPMILCTA